MIAMLNWLKETYCRWVYGHDGWETYEIGDQDVTICKRCGALALGDRL